jgi:CMP-N,N'-diacetyllegionaminic acid synthase
VQWLEDHEGYSPELVVCLQPTSPCRTSADIDGAVDVLRSRQADSVISVTVAHPHPYWTKRLDEQGRLTAFVPDSASIVRRQELPPAYSLNGAIYLVRREVLLSTGNWYTDKTFGYVMPAERSIDIDSAWDLRVADLLLRERKAARPASGPDLVPH